MPADEPDFVAFQDQPISQLLVKVAARCNIDCSYCYWFRDAAVHDKPKLMSAGVLHRLLRDGTIRVFSRLSVTPSVLKILLARVKACSASTRVRQVTTQSSAQRVSRHPPPIRTPPRGMLAHLLWRHPRRNNFRARRQSARPRSVGMELRLLSGFGVGPNQFRHRRGLRGGSRRFRSSMAGVPVEPHRGRFSVVSQFEFPLPTQTCRDR
jgi:hypothetical protein